jgi:hypothetical protein
MTSFTQDLFISYAHIDKQALRPDAFEPSSGLNLWCLGPSGLARSSNQGCLTLVGEYCASSMAAQPVTMALAYIQLTIFLAIQVVY